MPKRQNEIVFRRNAAEDSATVTMDGKTARVDLSQMEKPQRLHVITALVDWWASGFKGFPEFMR